MQRLLLPLFLFAGVLTVWFAGGDLVHDAVPASADMDAAQVEKIADTLIWLASGFLFIRLVDVLVWEGWFASRSMAEAPKLIRTVTGVILWCLVIIGIVSVVFGQSVTGLLTASSVVIAVVGFAVRSLIADLFYGMALAAERPFRIGDWVRLDDGVEGEVVEMNWRATRLITRRKMCVVIPNSMMAASRFENFNIPHKYFRESFEVRLDYGMTSHQAERLLLSAVKQTPESAALPEQPEARIKEFMPDGVVWELRFWVPDRPTRTDVKNKIQRKFLRNLYFAGADVARDKAEVIVESAARFEARSPVSAENWLARVDLFAALSDTELEDLRHSAEFVLCKVGEPIVREGEEGSSLFVLVEGSLKVTAQGTSGENITIATLEPGKCFGEMSLLTGAPRAATVEPVVDSQVYEITKDDLAPFLEQRPELASVMSAMLAERHVANKMAMEAADGADMADQPEALSQQFLTRIREFFGIGFLKSLKHEDPGDFANIDEKTFLEAAMAAAALVTYADGEIADEERAVVADVFTSIDMFRTLDADAGLSIYNRYLESLASMGDSTKQAIMETVAGVAHDPAAARVIVRLCCAISEADNRILDPERGSVRALCQILRLPPDEFGVA